MMASVNEAAKAARKLTSQFQAMALVSEVLSEIADLDQAQRMASSEKEAAEAATAIAQEAWQLVEAKLESTTRNLMREKEYVRKVKAGTQAQANAAVADAEKRAKLIVAEAQAEVREGEARFESTRVTHDEWMQKADKEKHAARMKLQIIQDELKRIKSRFD